MDLVLAGMVEPTQTGIYFKKKEKRRINDKVKSRKRKICEGTG